MDLKPVIGLIDSSYLLKNDNHFYNNKNVYYLYYLSMITVKSLSSPSHS